MQKIIVIVGPTSSGKSALAVELAKKLSGEVISADSRQVYKGLDIGTGKITKREMKGVPHHLLDVYSPKKTFTAHDFVVRGRKAIDDIASRGKLPIICGGTGFYIDALVGRITLSDVPANKKLRAELDKKTAEQLFTILKRRDQNRAQSIDQHNKRRLIRALEIAQSPKSDPLRSDLRGYDVIWVGIAPERDELRRRIDVRLRDRIKTGMIAEAKRLKKAGLSYKRMESLGLEYRSLARHLKGIISKEEMESELQSAIWQYAKRQKTYWRRNKDIEWFFPNSNAAIFKKIRTLL
ncbi:tRNA (adenosine(37)-N6)-dimethylallyltransferase MiaA [Candidatus Parcubacteria bacterium]|nr:MAG: tRNA (adenosine(37)-N6)-dimethylallyltransferase MiaA [Candidatus Parcubacteria bacterium]